MQRPALHSRRDLAIPIPAPGKTGYHHPMSNQPAPLPVPDAAPGVLHRLASPAGLALAGFGLLFVAGLLLWARFGATVFVDGLAMAWSCF